jgi:hypothetical protein
MIDEHYTYINELVKKIKEDETSALFELFSFYKPLIFSAISKAKSRFSIAQLPAMRKKLFLSKCFSFGIFIVKSPLTPDGGIKIGRKAPPSGVGGLFYMKLTSVLKEIPNFSNTEACTFADNALICSPVPPP